MDLEKKTHPRDLPNHWLPLAAHFVTTGGHWRIPDPSLRWQEVIKGSDVLNTKGVEELLRRVGLGRGNAR